MYLGSHYLNDFIDFSCETHNPTTGASSAATTYPTYRIYEQDNSVPILTGDMWAMDSDDTTGFYAEEIQVTAANGFEYDKMYTIRISGTVSGITAATDHSFKIKSLMEHNALVNTTWTDAKAGYIVGTIPTTTQLANLILSCAVMLPGTIDDTAFPSTNVAFEADDITEATADHYNGRIIIFRSGALLNQACLIEDYALVGGRGHFTVNRGAGITLTEAPANNDTFIII